jgi:hypothetical protein
MADIPKRFEDTAAMVERMAVKIMALPKEKRLYVIDSLRNGVLGQITRELNLKGTEAEHLLSLIVRGIEARVREMELREGA